MKLSSKAMVLALAAFALQSTLGFAENRISIGGISATGGGLQLVGSLSTTFADSGTGLETVGWVLIVGGSLVDGGTIANASAKTLAAPDVWDAIVRQSKVLASNPKLVKADVGITNAAKSLKLTTAQVANLVLELDKAAQDAKSASSDALATEAIEAKFFPKGFSSVAQRQSYSNLVALASMI